MSPPRKLPSRSFNTRRFTAACLLLITLAACAFVSNTIHTSAASRSSHNPQPLLLSRRGLFAPAREEEEEPLAQALVEGLDEPSDPDGIGHFSKKNRECRQLHHSKHKCKYVRKYCHDENAGLIPYLTIYYCQLRHVQPLALVALVAWTGTLFSTIGIAASDFFSVNLSTIASILGLSESLAGVTFLAFGNGSPDVFSTFAAMSSNSSSMAVGELVGAAGFITAVVAGSMALVREFKVSKRTFVRDILFFLVAATFTFALLLDGNLRPWECAAMIGFYLFYVVVVVTWHWYITRRQHRHALQVAARSNFLGPAQDVEPYRDVDDDDVDEEDRAAAARVRRTGSDDIRTLEEGARVGSDLDDDPDGVSGDRGSHVAAEMTSSMRVMRPRGRRATSTITPIRPSLVGALEFRSVLSSLQRDSNMQMRPLRYSGHVRSYSTDYLESAGPPTPERSQSPNPHAAFTNPNFQPTFQGLRSRALSSGDSPRGTPSPAPPIMNLIGISAVESTSTLGTVPPLLPVPRVEPRTRSPSPVLFKVDGRLAPPPRAPPSQFPTLRVDIPSQSPPGSETSSPALSEFPVFMESPLALSPSLPPQTPPQSQPQPLPSPSIEPSSGIESPRPPPRLLRWWPYDILPAPHVLSATLFPTLQDWDEKGVWGKFVGIISVPSIFLLIITLPVVETDDDCDLQDDDLVDSDTIGGGSAPDVAPTDERTHLPETEWQRYRRTNRPRGSGSVSHNHHPSPLLISVESPDETRASAVGVPMAASQASDPEQLTQPPARDPPRELHAPKPVRTESKLLDVGSDETLGWNRWLVAVQIATGPMFVVFILWANTQEDLENPARSLTQMLLYGWLFSLVLLLLLFLTTSAERKPRLHFLLCFLGFIISIAWISTVAGEVVGVLKAFGVIMGISEAILGLTIFAVGNSLGDLVADVTVARLGYPVMALSACFGGPMLNILLGIGLGGLFYNTDLHIEVGGTLVVSAVSLLVTLVALLVVVPLNGWIMSRPIGWGLIGLWTASTILNLGIEVSGVWKGVE